MKTIICLVSMTFILLQISFAQQITIPIDKHPDTSQWPDLFENDLSNATFPKDVWTFNDGILTATADEAIWSNKVYDNFIIDLQFKTEEGTNSGVIVYCNNKDNWIPNSVEIQIADDYSEKWANSPDTWHCAAIFGHLPASKSMVKKPGEWNHFTITCKDSMIYIILNDTPVNELNMSLWTSAEKNPDGSEIPAWLSTPLAELPTKGYIGLQGKHADASIYFRNIKIKKIN